MTDHRSNHHAMAVLRAFGREFPAVAGITEGRMFNGRGLRTPAGFFAFIGNSGDLVVKVPQPQTLELIADGIGSPMTIGARTMREWVRIPPDPSHDDRIWRQAFQRAVAFATEN